MATVTVIGGSGRMGAWFANFLSANGYNVTICDKNTSACRNLAKKKGFRFVKNPIEAAQVSEIVLLATPTPITKSMLEKIASQTTPTKLLVEISSIKKPVRKTIQKLTRHGTKIMSIHPMFGPGARSLKDKSIIVAQEPRDSAPARKLLSTFSKRGGKTIRSTLESHDQLMATVLGLPHVMNLAFIETIRQAGLSLDKAREIGGTTFKLQLLMAEALYHESTENEASILTDNKYNKRMFAAFVHQIKQVRDITRKKARSKLLNRLRSDGSYVRNSKLFGTAYERLVAAVEAWT